MKSSWEASHADRRGWIIAALRAGTAAAFSPRLPLHAGVDFPSKSEFPITEHSVYLNNGGAHPLGRGAIHAIQAHLEAEAAGTSAPVSQVGDELKAHFAALINAPVSTVSLIPRTISAENLIVTSLDLAHTRGNIVTDELHFQGSLNLYHLLQSKGVDIRIVKARDWRIELADVEKAIDRNTRLIAVSGVSQVNGFAPDLKALCNLAHSQRIYVYADMVQAVGAIPVDVQASGVDFCSCGSQKWLMGDEGLAFFYAREGLREEIVKRTQFGVRQMTGLQNHLFPNDTTLDEQAVPKPIQGPAFYLDVGVLSRTVMAALTYTLPLIRRLGVEAIQVHNSALVAQLRKEIPRLGYESATPEDSRSALVSFSYPAEHREATTAKLKKANVQVKIDRRVIRVSPSVYNDANDVDKLLEALA